MTKEQVEFLLAHGWSKELLVDIKKNLYERYYGNYPASITFMSPEFLVINNNFHIYKYIPLLPTFHYSMDKVTIWADGSGTNPRKPGGIGVVIETPSLAEPLLKYHNIGGATNNVAELSAIWVGLMQVPDNQAEVLIRSDSEYALGILRNREWVPKANQKLVEVIRKDLDFRPNVTFLHVKGHAGCLQQELCDSLAGVARKYAPQTLFLEDLK